MRQERGKKRKQNKTKNKTETKNPSLLTWIIFSLGETPPELQIHKSQWWRGLGSGVRLGAGGQQRAGPEEAQGREGELIDSG